MSEYKFIEFVANDNATPSADFYDDESDEEVISTHFPSDTPITPANFDIINQKCEEAEKYKEEVENSGEKKVYSEDVTFSSDAKEIEAEKRRTMIVGESEKIVETIREGTDEIRRTSADKEHVRKYEKTAQMPTISHGKPAEQKSGKPLIIFVIACICVGVFFGVQANSYYVYNGGSTSDIFQCSFGWITIENLPIVLEPLNLNVFMGAFGIGAGILAVIGLFIWLDNDAKKNSRVGHEHGSAHLGTQKDFKIFQNKFME